MITDARGQSAPAEPTRSAARVEREPRQRAAFALWLLMVGGFIGFVAAGTVTLGAGSRQGDEARVVDVWRRFFAALPDVGNATLLVIVVAGAIAAVLALSALGLWLALTASDRAAGSPTGEHGSA